MYGMSTLAIKHLLDDSPAGPRKGLLGERILGKDLSFEIRLVRGEGASSVAKSVSDEIHEGKMGEPRQRPPFPVQKGIDRELHPRCVNVET